MAISTCRCPGTGTGTSRSSTRRPPGRYAPVIVSVTAPTAPAASPDAVADGPLATRDPHRLRFAEQRVVDELDALHGRVVHVADLVQPGAEAPARPDALVAQPRLDRAEGRVARHRRHRVRHVRRAQPRRQDARPVLL